MTTRRQFIRDTTALAAAVAGARGRQIPFAAPPSALAEHTLAAIDTIRVPLRFPRPVGKNAVSGTHGAGPNNQCRVLRTDQGAVGWGMSYLTDAQIENGYTDRFIGRRVGDLIDPATGVSEELRFMDFPLHDLAGVILGQPVHELLGSRGETRQRVYSGMIYFDDLEPPNNPRGIEQVLENCRQDRDLGYRQLKVKIGRGNRWMKPPEVGLQRDIDVTRAIAENFPDIEILVDGNNGFTLDQFLRYLDGIGDVPLFWIEEPFPEEREPLQAVRDWLDGSGKQTLIAEGEAGFDKSMLLELANDGLVDVFLPDLAGLGFSNWRRLMPELIAQDVATSPHTWGSKLKTCYTAHLAAGMGNVVTVEGVSATSDRVDFSVYPIEDGWISVPDAPGFGLPLDHPWFAAV